MPTRTFVRYAPLTGTYFVLVASDKLPAARRFLATAPLALTDGGEGADATLSVAGASSGVRGVLRLTAGLGGTADAPDVRQLRVLDTGTPVLITHGEVHDHQVLARNGNALVGIDIVSAPGGVIAGNLNMGGHQVTNMGSAGAPDQAVTLGQVASMLNGLEWQASVINRQDGPPGSPVDGDRFLVGDSPSGAWVGHGGNIAMWKSPSWSFIAPNVGWTVHLDNGGHNLNFNGSAWVDIGASIDHASLLGLTSGDPHTQYQLRSDKDASNGYAGLTAGLLNAPAKRVRMGAPGGGPSAGDVWIDGPYLKFQDGGPTTQTLERQSNLGVPGGYMALDGGGKGVQPPASHAASHQPGGSDALPADASAGTAALRTLGNGAQQACAGNDGRLSDARTPTLHKASHMSGPDALSPADIGAAAVGRTIGAGTGLSGGGDLTADRTVQVAAFGGLVSHDFTVPSGTWTAGQLTNHGSVDVGDHGHLVLTGLHLPDPGSSGIEAQAVIVFQDAATPVVLANTVGAAADKNMQGLADALMGDLSSADANNGRAVRRVEFRAKNTTGGTITGVSMGPFRVRAYAFPRGGGSPL